MSAGSANKQVLQKDRSSAPDLPGHQRHCAQLSVIAGGTTVGTFQMTIIEIYITSGYQNQLLHRQHVF